ncbi:hypothetical protein ACIO3O_40080 [Streptomyces sp. NPDC087440]|uniref:hypothetical protein n=1 Tax=Streptomyces sp. NPDC087440 TaxID=3365790 RepID=UPI00381533CA
MTQFDESPPAPLSQRGRVLDVLLDQLTLEDKLELVRRVRVGALVLREGDRVEARRRLRGSYPHEGLEAEEGASADSADYSVAYDVPARTLGRVLRVRQYVTPFPYSVRFDTGIELSLAEDEITGVVEQPSEHEREQDDALWHIPADRMFSSACSLWIDRVGRACPQFTGHRGPCGLPPR